MHRFISFFTALSTTCGISLFSDCPCLEDKCSPIQEKHEIVPGYNAPNRIAVDGCLGTFAYGEFTYQIPYQENLELGIVQNTKNPSFQVDGKWLEAGFEYKPGFKVGLGVNLDRDHWDLHGQYAWVRGTHQQDEQLVLGGNEKIIAKFVIQDISQSAPATFYHASQSWRLEIDVIDLAIARRFAIGTSLSFHPFFWFAIELDPTTLEELL